MQMVYIGQRELGALRDKFGPLWSQKLKLLFTNFIQLVYKTKSQSVKFCHLFYFTRCFGNKNGQQIKLEIEKLQFWA